MEYATDDILDMLLWVLVNGARDHGSFLLPAHMAYVGAMGDREAAYTAMVQDHVRVRDTVRLASHALDAAACP